MKRFLTALLPSALLLAGCNSKPATTAGAGSASPKWYDQWLNSPGSLSHGGTVHSDLELDAGQTTTLQIPATNPIQVGIIVQKGYDVSKDKGWIWIGTPAKPHVAGTSTGTSQQFTPESGSVSLIVENESSVKTRVAIYTKAPD